MKVKLLRIEQVQPNMQEAETKINKEIQLLESKGHEIKDIKINAVRDAADEAKIKIRYTLTIAILYN